MPEEITVDLAGCWVDQTGKTVEQFNWRVIEMAEQYGFIVKPDDRRIVDASHEDVDEIEVDGREVDVWQGLNEISDEAVDYLNEHAPDGYGFEIDGMRGGLFLDEDSEICSECGEEFNPDHPHDCADS